MDAPSSSDAGHAEAGLDATRVPEAGVPDAPGDSLAGHPDVQADAPMSDAHPLDATADVLMKPDAYPAACADAATDACVPILRRPRLPR